MTKVVYNDCYGGFALSEKAVERLREIDPECAEAFVDETRWPGTARSHPALVRVVEELGQEASEEYSELRIAEIDGTQYRIGEYDGLEWVETPESITWITAYEKVPQVEQGQTSIEVRVASRTQDALREHHTVTMVVPDDWGAEELEGELDEITDSILRMVNS